MNKIIVSSWVAPLYCDLEIHLDNADKVILNYKQTKNLPDIVKSVKGNNYTLIVEGEQIKGFQLIE